MQISVDLKTRISVRYAKNRTTCVGYTPGYEAPELLSCGASSATGNTCERVRVCTCMHTYVWVRTCVGTCEHACVRACVCACACACVRACVRVQVHAKERVCGQHIFTHGRTYLHMYLYVCVRIIIFVYSHIYADMYAFGLTLSRDLVRDACLLVIDHLGEEHLLHAEATQVYVLIYAHTCIYICKVYMHTCIYVRTCSCVFVRLYMLVYLCSEKKKERCT